jgi:protein involved in polysaccharide export with SLBB domain
MGENRMGCLARVVLSAILLAAWPLEGQLKKEEEEEKTVIELKQPPPVRKAEQEEALIGMEAYREVLASGQYLIGPGDEFLVHVPGMDQAQYMRVLAEGGIFIPQVGKVQVGGLRLKEARQRVEESFNGAVRVGKLTFELSRPRFFPVPVLGMVQEPGLKGASGVERISEVIAKAGPPLPSASTRNIQLFKTGSLDPGAREHIRAMIASGKFQTLEGVGVSRVDLALYQITGESAFNPFVEDGDIVVVPPQTGQSGALGAVQRPGFYELVKGDRLSDLLTLGMGPAPNYDPDNVVLFRFNPDMVTRVAIPIDLRRVLEGDPQANMSLQPDDWLNLREISGYHQKSEVRVVGEVVYPGYYVVGQEGIALREVIEQAGGFTENASLVEARIVRQQILGEASVDPELERIRTVPVADRTEDENQYFIMKTRERIGQMVVDFVDLFERGDETQNIRLLPGDVIVVPSQPRTVTVSGAVARPGAVVYDEAYSVWDYIERSGGYGWRASKDVRVIKARTGEIKRARDAGQIQPGDRIWVKEKPVRDYWALFTQGMGVIGQVSTVVLLYATLTK